MGLIDRLRGEKTEAELTEAALSRALVAGVNSDFFRDAIQEELEKHCGVDDLTFSDKQVLKKCAEEIREELKLPTSKLSNKRISRAIADMIHKNRLVQGVRLRVLKGRDAAAAPLLENLKEMDQILPKDFERMGSTLAEGRVRRVLAEAKTQDLQEQSQGESSKRTRSRSQNF